MQENCPTTNTDNEKSLKVNQKNAQTIGETISVKRTIKLHVGQLEDMLHAHLASLGVIGLNDFYPVVKVKGLETDENNCVTIEVNSFSNFVWETGQ